MKYIIFIIAIVIGFAMLGMTGMMFSHWLEHKWNIFALLEGIVCLAFTFYFSAGGILWLFM